MSRSSSFSACFEDASFGFDVEVGVEGSDEAVSVVRVAVCVVVVDILSDKIIEVVECLLSTMQALVPYP